MSTRLPPLGFMVSASNVGQVVCRYAPASIYWVQISIIGERISGARIAAETEKNRTDTESKREGARSFLEIVAI